VTVHCCVFHLAGRLSVTILLNKEIGFVHGAIVRPMSPKIVSEQKEMTSLKSSEVATSVKREYLGCGASMVIFIAHEYPTNSVASKIRVVTPESSILLCVEPIAFCMVETSLQGQDEQSSHNMESNSV